MKVADAVEYMTKAYLHRIIDSFTKDFPKPDVERAREIILRNTEELTDSERIATVLSVGAPYSDQILTGYILEALTNRPDYRATESEIVEEVTELEQELLDESGSPDALRYEDDHAVDVLRSVLEVALEDEKVSTEERNLIERLRRKLGIHEKSERIILAQLEHFPRAGNELHQPSEFRDMLLDLQRRGIVFYCNRLDDGCYVVPDEIVPGVKDALNIELSRTGWAKLLQSLTNEDLKTILEEADLPKYGAKDELAGRVIAAGMQPSEALESLTFDALYDVCSRLPGAKVSGSKDEKVRRIIDYFDKLVVKEVPEEASPGELYYQYLVELAHRDRENLLANDVIKKDREIDSAFEDGTRYLFSEKLGLELFELDGSDNPDGCFEMGRRGEVLMWGNKSKEDVYTFPRSLLTQFKRYIRDSDRRVSCFLVIVPKVDEEAGQVAARLKVESKTDTDVSVLSAEDLVWLAERWDDSGDGQDFDPEVFNVTGILDRSTLEQRMGVFL